jgi:K+-transporting ATPase ATPase A chain
LLPSALVVSLVLVASGVPMTWRGAARATSLEGVSETIARGPAAALVPIKQLGTIGGGFFGPNSAHPLENPTAWSNLVEVAAIIVLPMAAIVAFGLMIKDKKHAAVVFGVMLVPALAAAACSIWLELGPSQTVTGLSVAAGPNLEGKEVRLGATATATWSAITTAASNGAVNGMLDSFQPLSVLAALSLMLLNAIFSGVGSGFMHMLLYIIMAVFLGGLMVGRTPEYLGKKVEARDLKLAMLALLLHPLIICVPTATFAASEWGRGTVGNPGASGFSEIVYEFASSAATNGSGLEGLSDNNPPWNIATGIVMLLGRYPALILPLAIAGSLSKKPRLPHTPGTLNTNDLTFAGLLLGTMILVGALSFMPALVLGPVASSLSSGSP